MSLINDALKRASQSLKEQDGKPKDGLHFTPAEYRSGPGLRTVILVPVLLVGLIAAIGLFIWYCQPPKERANVPAETARNIAPTAIHTPPPNNPLPLPAPNVAPPVSALTATQSLVAFAPPTNPATPATVSSAESPLAKTPTPAILPKSLPTFPSLKIQAIYYRRSKPSAMINGRTVYVGENVAGAIVVRIDRQSVTFRLEDVTKTVDMNAQ